ncbi:putative toxin-antitoxin system toxin component, PIN family [uncultured Aquincola sp.]|uniref:putative toxin-antitoxin system toxin component, PIN family n=1 Tax=uncultured Aquincola sp. TaxID=886556 RepID=UPI0032B1662B
MRLVLDTNVVASAMLWGGSPKLLLQAARELRVELFSSSAILVELEDILGRKKFGKKLAASGMSREQLAAAYARLAPAVRPVMVVRIAPDPDDDVIIGTALAARADAVVTGDKALLSVGQHQAVQIITVAQALAWLADPPSA